LLPHVFYFFGVGFGLGFGCLGLLSSFNCLDGGGGGGGGGF